MKRFFVKIVFLAVITILPLVVFNYLIDPLQCFRVAKWYKPLYDPNERVQSACLARSHSYDTAIVGSSHVENIDPVFVDDTFGVSSVRLTIAASTLFEQNQVLSLALDRGIVKNVIWGLDTNILYDEPKRVRDDLVPFPYYIYEPNFLNNLLFLLDPYQIKHYTKMAIHQFTGKFDEFTDLRNLNSWEHLFVFSEERVWQVYQAVSGGKMAAMQNTNENLEVSNLDILPTENIDKNVVDLIKNNPDTHFIVYFPPYSILRFVELYQDDRQKLEAEWKLKDYLISQLFLLKNVNVFDFQVVKEITHNLNNYKDLTHYSGEVDEYIIFSLRQNKHLLDKNFVSSSLIVQKQIVGFKVSIP